MKLVQKTKELQLINDYYKNCLLKYTSNGFIHSNNISVNKIIQSLTFTCARLHQKGLIEADVSFYLNNSLYYKKIALNDTIEYTTYNYLTESPVHIQVTMRHNNESLYENLMNIHVFDNEREIEEWLAEINIINFIRQVLSN